MPKQPERISTVTYEIVLQGKIPAFREQWFDGMSIRYDNQGNSILRGEIADQSALHGVLNKIRDLGLTLISVKKIEETA